MNKIMFRKIGLFPLTIILSVICFSAGGALADQWSTIYGGSSAGRASSVRQTSDGGYIVAGSTSSSGAGKFDVWVMKLDVSGQVVWQKTYGGAEDDEAYAIEQTSDDGYILAGYTSSFGAGKKDVLVLKLDSDGNVEWQISYGGAEDDEASSVQQTAEGGYIVAGCTSSFGGGKKDLWVLKLDGGGQAEWLKTYGGAEDDEAFSVKQTSDDGYILAGYTSSFGAGQKDLWVVKLDQDGTAKWYKTYGGVGDEVARAILELSGGGYVVAGWMNSSGSLKVDAWILKLDADGNTVWQRTGRGSGDEVAHSIEETLDGNLIVAGSSSSSGAGKEEGWIFKLSSGGSMLWQKILGGAGSDEYFSVQQATDGGYVAAGWSNTAWPNFTNGDHYEAWVSKFDASGNITGCLIFGTALTSLGSTSVSGVLGGNAVTGTPQVSPQLGSLSAADGQAVSGAICNIVQEAEIVTEPLTLDFGKVVMGSSTSQTVTLENAGSKDLAIETVDIIGTNHLDFGLRNDSCSSKTVKSLESCSVEVGFSPSGAGKRVAGLSIPSNAANFSTLLVPLNGEGTAPISLTQPADHTSFSSCSLYQIPTFVWDVTGSFRNYEIQFADSPSFSSSGKMVKVKATSNSATPKANVWKQIMKLPVGLGGAVYWRVFGVYTGGKTGYVSEDRSFTVEPAEPVKNPKIDSTSITSVPTLTWENNCNVSFKVWFGIDEQFSKKYMVSFKIKDPLDGEGIFRRTLTSGQWDSVKKLVGGQIGSSIYWKVESWDGANRESQTATSNFVLIE